VSKSKTHVNGSAQRTGNGEGEATCPPCPPCVETGLPPLVRNRPGTRRHPTAAGLLYSMLWQQAGAFLRGEADDAETKHVVGLANGLCRIAERRADHNRTADELMSE
jgi:hypothetical protein